MTVSEQPGHAPPEIEADLQKQRAEVEANAARDLARELAALREERAEAAADVVGGDGSAVVRLEQLEARIAAAEREQERAEAAEAVLLRREREAAAVQAEAERDRIEAEAGTLEAQRDDVIARAVVAARAVAQLALEAVEIDRRIEMNRRSLGMSHRAIEGSMLIDRISLEFRDVGIVGGFEPMRAAWRASLLERWPTPIEGKAAVPLCSICAHEQRDAIEAALAGGEMTLRAIEELYGTSRSALSRHRQHAASQTTVSPGT